MATFDEMLAGIRPAVILDVGCGCGDRTLHLCRHAPRVIGVDVMTPPHRRWAPIRKPAELEFGCMDARRLGFPDACFPLVLERDSLHHIDDWKGALEEMIRVSYDAILIDEPVDDLRTIEKTRSYEAQCLFLELQQEVGYSHFRHLAPEALITTIGERVSIVAAHVETCDTPVSFEAFFESYDVFAQRSGRADYWRERREAFRATLGTTQLCDDDRLTILATKRPRG